MRFRDESQPVEAQYCIIDAREMTFRARIFESSRLKDPVAGTTYG